MPKEVEESAEQESKAAEDDVTEKAAMTAEEVSHTPAYVT